MVINIILLHIAKAMYSRTSEVVIIPQFPIEETTFTGNMEFSMPQSFSGVVDYLLAHVPPGNFCSKQPLCIVFLFFMSVKIFCMNLLIWHLCQATRVTIHLLLLSLEQRKIM